MASPTGFFGSEGTVRPKSKDLSLRTHRPVICSSEVKICGNAQLAWVLCPYRRRRRSDTNIVPNVLSVLRKKESGPGLNGGVRKRREFRFLGELFLLGRFRV